jgi:hypothetical protein
MSRVDYMNDILSIVRRKVDETARVRAASSAQKSASNAGVAARVVHGRVDANELERRVIDRIRKIPADERDFTKKAGRIFVDAVMAWEFGEELLLDTEYDEMAHSVVTTLLEHDATRQIMEQMFRGPAKKSTSR